MPAPPAPPSDRARTSGPRPIRLVLVAVLALSGVAYGGAQSIETCPPARQVISPVQPEPEPPVDTPAVETVTSADR